MWVVSKCGEKPKEEKLKTTTYSLSDFKKEISTLRQGNILSNYLTWGFALVVMCLFILLIFS